MYWPSYMRSWYFKASYFGANPAACVPPWASINMRVLPHMVEIEQKITKLRRKKKKITKQLQPQRGLSSLAATYQQEIRQIDYEIDRLVEQFEQQATRNYNRELILLLTI